MSNAKIISVISGKGGVGKTFFASNLAFALMSEANAKVLLIGMDNKGGNDIGSVFNIDVMRNASDVLELINKFNLDLIKGYLTKYQATGLDLLPVHSSIDINNINKLLDCLSSIYTYIIVDVSTLFGESEIVIFDKSDMIIVVTTPEVLSVRHTKSMYEMLVNRYHFPREIFKFIANFWTLEYENVDFISLFSQSPVLKIPYDRDLVSSSLDMGIPVLTKNPGSSISKAIRNFANEINNKDNFFAKAKASNAEINMSLSENSNTGTFQDLSLLKEKVHKKLVEVMSFKNIDIDSYEINSKGKELEIEIKKVIEDIFAYECSNIFLRDQRTKLVDEILDEVLGLGPLEDFIRDEEITEIMVNNKDQIYVEKKGKIFLTDKKFRSDKQLRAIIERIVASIGRRIDESVPYVDARLLDGSRVNAVIPPLALKGPCLTIRKFSKKQLTVDDLIKFGALTKEAKEFLCATVLARKNILVSGGTGSGKTTLLNVLSSFIPSSERIVTIEDSAELKLVQEHVVALESRPPNIEGKGAVSIRDLVRNSLRMRPDRIIVGECRGAEALDMLQAFNTGHDGSLTTLHSNSPRDTLARLETMVLMAGMDLSLRAIREQIASAVELIIHQSRFKDGTRKITHITEVVGMEGDIITTQDIFTFNQTGVNSDGRISGELVSTGIIPVFFEDLFVHGIELDKNMFVLA